MKKVPQLFGIKNSNRDFSKKESWSKNKFNVTFPVSLVAYMSKKGLKCVYIKLDANGKIKKSYISAKTLLGCDPLSEELYYSFEASYTKFQPYVIGKCPTVDVMLMNFSNRKILKGYEVKLTTLPDESTCLLSEQAYGSELVVRMPTIHFLACSLADIYKGNFRNLKQYFGKNGFGSVSSYMEAAQVNPCLGDIWHRMDRLIKDNITNQKPVVIQPIWKTVGKSNKLAKDCLDVFVWSDLAFTQLFMREAIDAPLDPTKQINRPTRTLIQLFFMLNEVSLKGTFHKDEIFQKLTYTMKNDKAFAVSGRKTNPLMQCEELHHPRISKYEIKNIVLGGGQHMLSPERRFDAALVNATEIFTS